jgi:phosphoribosylanthranilate isomerase
VRKVKVKICGITRKEDLDAAATAGADAVGFIVGIPASPRNLMLEDAEKLIRQVPTLVRSVLVTVAAGSDQLMACERLNPDAIQIHGEHTSDAFIRQVLPRTHSIRAVKADPANAGEAAIKASEIFDAVLLDSFANAKLGGTGVVHDWKLSRHVRQAIHPKPLILAGGLNPENVAEAVRLVQPYAVDVSSGVEIQPGIKSRERIVEFVKNAKDVEI